MVLHGLWNQFGGSFILKTRTKWDSRSRMLFVLIFFFFLMIHSWVRCQGLRKRTLYFSLDWMTLKELAELLVLIHFSLCLRVSFKNKTAVTSECCHGVWWDLTTGLWALWFLAREMLKIGGHQVPAPSLGNTARVSRVLYKLPGFALLSQGSPAAPMTLLPHSAQAALQHHQSNPSCPCLSAES